MMATTELGREIAHDDWVGFHRDRLLSFFAQTEHDLTVEQVSALTGLDADHADRLLDALSAPPALVCRSISEFDSTRWRITSQGRRWVAESPRPTPTTPSDPSSAVG